MLYFVLVGLVSLFVCSFCFGLVYVCASHLNSFFNKNIDNVPRGSSLGEAKEQVQGLRPIDLGLITNIFSNPIHSSENAPIPSNPMQKKKKTREVDLLQCYVYNPSLTTPIHIAHLPPNLQTFTRTPSLSLRLCLPGQTKHFPMHPIPKLNIMVELPHELL
jgi:hypothetical protein